MTTPSSSWRRTSTTPRWRSAARSMLGDEMIDEASAKMALVVAAKGAGGRAHPYEELHTLRPTAVKNQNDDVSQSPTSTVNDSPPSTGSVQPGVAALGQGQHLRGEQAVEEAAEQRVREHAGHVVLQAERVQAVEGDGDRRA